MGQQASRSRRTLTRGGCAPSPTLRGTTPLTSTSQASGPLPRAPALWPGGCGWAWCACVGLAGLTQCPSCCLAVLCSAGARESAAAAPELSAAGGSSGWPYGHPSGACLAPLPPPRLPAVWDCVKMCAPTHASPAFAQVKAQLPGLHPIEESGATTPASNSSSSSSNSLVQPQYHFSLSRTVPIRLQQRDSLLAALKQQLR